LKNEIKWYIYIYIADIGYYDLGSTHPLKPYNQPSKPFTHPLKPFRLRMAHALIIEYDLGYYMDILVHSNKI